MQLVTLIAEAPITVTANFPDTVHSTNVTPLKLTLGIRGLYYALQ